MADSKPLSVTVAEMIQEGVAHIRSEIVKAQSELEKNRPVKAWKHLELAFKVSDGLTIIAANFKREEER